MIGCGAQKRTLYGGGKISQEQISLKSNTPAKSPTAPRIITLEETGTFSLYGQCSHMLLHFVWFTIRNFLHLGFVNYFRLSQYYVNQMNLSPQSF